MSIASRIESITEHLTNDWDIVDSLGLYTKKLPKEYTQVDYIASSGTQYIDTGVNADYKLSVKTKIKIQQNLANSMSGAGIISSASSGVNRVRHHFQFNNNTIMYFAGTGDSGCNTVLKEPYSDEIYEILCDIYNKKYYVNNQEITGKFNSDNFDTELNYLIFARNNSGTPDYRTKMILYSCQMYYNNELVRDFIPCYRNSDNEVGLYDLVNNVFYTNQGTGAFTYGEMQEEHINRNLENLSLPLNYLYKDISNKTDISQNGAVGRTSQETTTGANLMPVVNVTKTVNGITLTNNKNGTITLNGTATAQIVYPITNTGNNTSRSVPVTENDYKFMLYGDTNVSNDTYFLQVLFGTETETTKFFAATDNGATSLHIETNRSIGYALIIRNGQSFNNHIIKPMGVLSTYTGGFEPYTNGASPNPDYPQSINNLSGNVTYKVSGKNKLQIRNIYTSKGITSTYDKNTGYITSKGTTSASYPWINDIQVNISAGTTITLSSDLSSYIAYVRCYYDTSSYEQVSTTNDTTRTRTLEHDINRLVILVNVPTNTEINETYYLQLEKGNEVTSFEPYIDPQTFNIPLKSKNKLDTSTVEIGTKNGVTCSYNNETHEITFNGTCTTNNTRFLILNNSIPFTINTTTICAYLTNEGSNTGNGLFRVFADDYETHDYLNLTTLTSTNRMISKKTSATIAKTIFDFRFDNGAFLDNFTIKLMVTDSEDATYEPYYDIELCDIDTYEDKIYSSDGRFYLNKNIGNHLFTTSDNIQKGGSSTDGYARCGWGSSSEIATSDFDKILVKCNKFLGISQNNNGTSVTGEHWYCSLSNTDAYKIMFRCGDTEYTRDTFLKFIKNNEIIVYYPLATPTTTEITQENYPSLYNALKQIQDYLTAYKINKEFILGYSSPEIEY